MPYSAVAVGGRIMTVGVARPSTLRRVKDWLYDRSNSFEIPRIVLVLFLVSMFSKGVCSLIADQQGWQLWHAWFQVAVPVGTAMFEVWSSLGSQKFAAVLFLAMVFMRGAMTSLVVGVEGWQLLHASLQMAIPVIAVMWTCWTGSMDWVPVREGPLSPV